MDVAFRMSRENSTLVCHHITILDALNVVLQTLILRIVIRMVNSDMVMTISLK